MRRRITFFWLRCTVGGLLALPLGIRPLGAQTRADLGRLTSAALSAMERRDWDRALATWDSAFTIEANNYPLWYAAQASCQRQDTVRAARYFARAEASLRENPENFPAFEADTLTRCLHATPKWQVFLADMGRGYRDYTARRAAWATRITDSTQRLSLRDAPAPHRVPPTRDHWTLYSIRAVTRRGDSIDVPMLTYIPKAYTPRRATPVVVFLHGAVSGRSRFSVDYEVPRYEAMAAEAERRGWFLLWPFARRDFNWIDDVASLDAIARMIMRLQRTYAIDSTRILVSGHSDGGRGALWFALCRPGLATATVHFSTWPSVAEYRGCDPTAVTPTAPLLAMSGEADGLFADSLTTPRWRALQERGVPLERIVLPNRGHDVGTTRDDVRAALDRVDQRWRERQPIGSGVRRREPTAAASPRSDTPPTSPARHATSRPSPWRSAAP